MMALRMKDDSLTAISRLSMSRAIDARTSGHQLHQMTADAVTAHQLGRRSSRSVGLLVCWNAPPSGGGWYGGVCEFR